MSAFFVESDSMVPAECIPLLVTALLSPLFLRPLETNVVSAAALRLM